MCLDVLSLDAQCSSIASSVTSGVNVNLTAYVGGIGIYYCGRTKTVSWLCLWLEADTTCLHPHNALADFQWVCWVILRVLHLPPSW